MKTRFVQFIARQKFRFDQGQGFLSIVNLILVSVAASGKIEGVTGLGGIKLLAVLVPAVLCGVWAFGFLLDRAGFPKSYQAEVNNRNGLLKEISEKVGK